jgi:tetratricopeptide (TPR) repeat protein
VLILALSYLFLLASTHNGLVSYDIFWITTGLFAVFTVLWIVFGQAVGLKKELMVIAFLGVLAIAAYFSIDPRRSFTEVWLIGAALFLFLLASDLVNRGWDVELWVKALLIVGAIIMALTWREAIVWYWQWLGSTGKIWPDLFYRLPAPNFLAIFLNVLLMVAGASFVFSKSKAARCLLGIWMASAVGLIYLTSSRGGWLGTAAGLGVVIFFTALAFPEKRKALFDWMRRHRFITIMIFIAGFTALLVFGWVFYQHSKLPSHAAVGVSRAFLWSPAWQAFLRSPIIGSGPYTYISFFVQQQSTPPSPLYLYAHSIYLDLLSGSGVVGLAVFLVMIAGLIAGLIGKFRTTTGAERGAAVAALGALAAFLVHGVADSVHHTIPTAAWLLAVVFGVGIGNRQEEKPHRLGLSVMVGLVLVLTGAVNLWAEKPMMEGVIAGNSGMWQEAKTNLEETIARDPGLATGYQQLGLVESKLAEQGRTAELENAIAHFEQAVEKDPYWGLNHANLGVLYREQGDLPRSVDELEKAVGIAPKSALYLLNLGVSYEMLGRDEAAIAAYDAALLLQPIWVNSSFFRETSLRSDLAASRMVDEAVKKINLAEAEENLKQAQLRMSAYLEVIPFYLEVDRLEDVEQAIRYAKLAYSTKVEERLVLQWYEADLAAQKGDLSQAARLGDDVVQRYLWQGINGPGTLGQLMYNQLVFRRPAMVMETVPQMAMILLPDEWGARLYQVAEWHRQAGDEERAEGLLQELRRHIPDFVIEME